ncbi:ABC transporter family protein [Cryptosporidium andersoni]|uniref:ABC transporter family protein n=1 Tax=Cryptosporidium andersoni TaxID=117008 RepID=A0A1J4MNZ3_9CRYT|nr:ABC transporter family protein [Cryptosporidium andersoni]
MQGLRDVWNLLFFSFISPYILPTYNSSIKSLDDLPVLFKSDNLEYWVKRISDAFDYEEYYSMYKRHGFCIYTALFWSLWKPFLATLSLRLLFDIAGLFSLFGISLFSFSSTKRGTLSSVLYIFISILVKSLIDCHSRFLIARFCIKIEGSLILIALDRVIRHKDIYTEIPLTATYMVKGGDNPMSCRKSLLLRQREVKFNSSNAANQSSNVFNLIVGDALAIEHFLSCLVDLILLPIRLFLAWCTLTTLLGASSAFPAILTFSIVLFLSFLFEIIGALNKEPFMSKRDERIDRCHEVLSDIRSIRTAGLEDVVIKRITKSRIQEMFWNKKRFIFSRIAGFFDYHLKSYSQYVLFVTFLYYIVKYPELYKSSYSISTGATALQVLMQLSSGIRTLPTNIIEGTISLQRYATFIKTHPVKKSKNLETTNTSKNQECNEDYEYQNLIPSEYCKYNRYLSGSCSSLMRSSEESLIYQSNTIVSIRNGIFSWDSSVNRRYVTNINKATLLDINFSVKLGECVFLVGEPGCGKSSLIKAVLDEIYPISAEVFVQPKTANSTIAYASQLPWIPSGSIRSIIVFGRKWDEQKYSLVVNCCQLNKDFESWQDGDLRTVDEGGFSLSGGQRARISLARALYSLPLEASKNLRSDELLDPYIIKAWESVLYLFDDIFVSIDPRVGSHIFRRLFGKNGLLVNMATIISISIDSLHHYMTQMRIDGHNRNELSTDNNTNLNNLTTPYTKQLMFTVIVMNDGRIHWTGSYDEYIQDKYCRDQLIAVEDIEVEETKYLVPIIRSASSSGTTPSSTNEEQKSLLNTPKSITSSFVVTKSEHNDKQKFDNETDTKLSSENCKGRVSGKSYRWYLGLLGIPWVIIFLVGCILKVAIDRMLELTLVNKSANIEISRSAQSTYNLCIQLTVSLLIESLISFLIFIGEALAGINAAMKSHETFLSKVILAPFWFYDVNSIGRILNRFSSDMLAIDNCIIRRITAVISPVLSFLFNFIFVAFKVPQTILFEFLIVFLTIKFIARSFIATYRDAQRCALLAQSPLCSTFSESLSGASIIRAYRVEQLYLDKCLEFVNKLQRARLLQHAACQWAGIRLQFISAPLSLVVPIFDLFFPTSRETLIMPLTYSITFAESINDIIFRLMSLEKDMCSVERVYEYIRQLKDDEVNQPQILFGNSVIPDERSGIVISDLEVRYRRPIEKPDNYYLNIDGKKIKYVDSMYFTATLRNINQIAGPNDHIGIVGRTGSGKSTFIMALLGLVPTTKGNIYLDGIPINQLPPATKRKLVGVLPQVPLLLKGWTVRDFLDPERQRSSEDLWEALRICGLSSTIRSLPGEKMLDTILVPDIDINAIHEVGIQELQTEYEEQNHSIANARSNITDLVAKYLSDSQLRYLSLARLVVNARDYRMILVDEPPPDISDEQICGKACYIPVHELLRTYFPHCTVFVVAHHAASLQKCNKIWVLGGGTIKTVINSTGIIRQSDLASLLKNH